MKYYLVRPIVDVSQGEKTEYAPGSDHRKLASLHMVLEDWSGNDVVTTTPGFAVTRRLADHLAQSDLSGFELKDMHLSVSENGSRAMREKNALIPELVWLDITGAYTNDDFFFEPGRARLIVSDRALDQLQEFELSDARIEEFQIQ